MPENDETLALFECYHRTHDRRVRDELTELHFGLAQSLARRFRGRGESPDDLLQVASLGLLKAIERFDPARGMQFSTFAVPTILGELKRHFRDKAWLIRVPRSMQELHLEIRQLTEDLTHELGSSPTAAQIAERAGCPIDEVVAAINAGNAFSGRSIDAPAAENSTIATIDQLAAVDCDADGVGDREELRGLLAALDGRERQVITLRFFEDLTQSQIAERLGISQMQVSRLLSRALSTMRGQASTSTQHVQPTDDLSPRLVRAARGIGTIECVGVTVSELAGAPDGHVVHFYDADDELVDAVSPVLAEGLSSGGAVVVVATLAHRAALEAAIAARGIDLEAARTEDSYVTADAAELLAAFMVGDQPDPVLFDQVVGSVVALAAGTRRPVSVYGEMVGLLWGDGQYEAAIELEALWNALGHRRDFSLYCGYPMSAVSDTDNLASVKAVCDRHAAVVTPASYTPSADVGVAAGEGAERSAFFLPGVFAPGAVRRLVAETLLEWRCDNPGIILVASELATNAVVHAQSPFRFSLSLHGSVVDCEVEDASGAVPTISESPTRSSGGRGLRIVDALSLAWGTELRPDGKIVWAKLDAQASAPPAP